MAGCVLFSFEKPSNTVVPPKASDPSQKRATQITWSFRLMVVDPGDSRIPTPEHGPKEKIHRLSWM